MSAQQDALVAAIEARLREGRLPCSDAFTIAQEVGVLPAKVAAVADERGIRIGWCQLGLFAGAHREKAVTQSIPVEVSPALREHIQAALEERGLPCARAWGVAKRLGLQRIEVGEAADALAVRIIRCQLGCFA